MAAIIKAQLFDPEAFNQMWLLDPSDPEVPQWQRAEWVALRAVLTCEGAPQGGCDPKYYMGALLNQLQKTEVFDLFAECKNRVIGLAADCQKLFHSIMHREPLRGCFEDFINKNNREILIPLGWRGDPDGHFLLCLIQGINDQSIQLHFYNAQPTKGCPVIKKQDLDGKHYQAWSLPIAFTCTKRFSREELCQILSDQFSLLITPQKGQVSELVASIYGPLCEGGEMVQAEQTLEERDLRKRCVPLAFEMFVRSQFHLSLPPDQQESASKACDAFFQELKRAAHSLSADLAIESVSP